MWNVDNPFDSAGNYVFNKWLFIDGQQDPLELRAEY